MSVMDSSNLSPDEIRQALLSRLGQLRRKIRGQLLLEGAARTLVIIAGLILALFILDRTFRLSLAARLILLAVALATAAYSLIQYVIAPLRLKLESLTLAAALDAKSLGAQSSGKRQAEITAQVATILALPELMHGTHPPSAAMVKLAVSHSHDAIAAVDFNSRLDVKRQKTAFLAILAAIVVPMILAISFPASARLWAARFFLASNQPWPQRTYLAVADLKDGVLVVPRGEPFVLRVSAKDGSVTPAGVTISYRQPDGTRSQANLANFAANDFRYDFAGISGPVSAEVWGGDDVFGPFTIRPAERPRLIDLKLVSQHPTEPKPTVYLFTGEDSDLSFLPKTKMQLLFAANTPIARARITSSTTRPSGADVRQIDDEHFAMDWTQERDVQLQIELVSRDAELSSMPTVVSIGLKKDQPPRVTMGYTGVHQRVTPHAKIPLTVEARDDYGVAQTSLVIKTERPDSANPGQFTAQTNSQILYGPVIPTTDLETQQAKTLELTAMKLDPGSLLTVSATATDNCYTGPQTTASRQVTFRIVPPEELFRELLLRQQADRAKFRKQADAAQTIRQELSSGSLAAASDVSHAHRAVQREVNAITASLLETVTEMRLNELANDEAYALIEKNVLTPLKNLNEQLLNPQKDALDTLKPDDAKALSDAEDRQDQIVAQMQEILRQMAQWDSFVDVLNQLNEIIRIQDQAQQTTNLLKKQQTEGIFEK